MYLCSCYVALCGLSHHMGGYEGCARVYLCMESNVSQVSNAYRYCLLQVVVCSFVYGGSNKTKNKQLAICESDMNSTPQPSNKSASTTCAPPSLNFTPSAMSGWPGPRILDQRNPHTEIDLTRG